MSRRSRSRRPSPFASGSPVSPPFNIPGLVLFLEADYGVVLNSSTGKVEQWDNRVRGPFQSVVQSGDGLRPTYSNASGKPRIVRGAGVAMGASASTLIPAASPVTMIHVGNGAASTGEVMTIGNSIPAYDCYLYTLNNTIFVDKAGNGNTAAGLDTSTPSVWTWFLTPGQAPVFYQNGVSLVVGNAGTTGLVSAPAGTRGFGFGNAAGAYNGYTYAMLVYTGILTNAQEAYVRDYLTKKWLT